MELSALIRQLIGNENQGDFAEEIGVTQATVSRWLSGADPRGRHRDRIVELAKRRGLIEGDDRPRMRGVSQSRFVAVPLVTWMSAGRFVDVSTQVPEEDFPRLPLADLGAGDFVAFRVSGDSMDRISPDGSIIVVNRRDRLLQEGKPYVFVIRSEATYKVWRARPPRLEPYSTNPANEPIFVEKRGAMETLGRVRRTLLDL